MGTLTAGQPRLDHYCEHKLPTSCRLTSIGECCACYDERAHSSAYSVYVDGVGFVLGGTRWHKYCWFCKVFWDNRVEASGLRSAQTRIPHVPDQSEFLARWYEFHQGYRIVTREDGSEERVAVIGEDFGDVSPGCLPRTVEELRAGRARSELEAQEREANRRQQQQEMLSEQPAVPEPTLEETLDQMLESAASEESEARAPERRPVPSGGSNIHAQAMVPTGTRNREYQIRRVAALRRELLRMRNGIERVISGLRDLGENVPDHSDASDRLTNLGRTLESITLSSREETDGAINDVNALVGATETTQQDRTVVDVQARVDEAQRRVRMAQSRREQAREELESCESELRSAQTRLRQLQTQQRTAENYTRLFGTREEVEAQGENYESPIGGMFSRAYARFNVAEEVRREDEISRQMLDDGVNTWTNGSGTEPFTTTDHGRDAHFVISAILERNELQLLAPQATTTDFVRRLRQRIEQGTLSSEDQAWIESVLESIEVIWATGLPAERNRRRRQRGERVSFGEDAFDNAIHGIVVVHDVEVMSEAFQMSSAVRELSGMRTTAQLSMCSRLQQGHRNTEDRDVLTEMLKNDEAIGRAREVLEQMYSNAESDDLWAQGGRPRREGDPATHQGYHSGAEMDAQRRAAQTLAVAAGRVAMHAGPAMLLEQMAERDPATRAAYQRLRMNMDIDMPETPRLRPSAPPLRNGSGNAPGVSDFSPRPTVSDSEDGEESSDEDAKGLDAKDTGRPADPLTDEQMTVKLDCQICYTQLADVACLPCGHLVMCQWCSEQHSPTLLHDRTRPRRTANCPVCRKQVKQKVRVWRS